MKKITFIFAMVISTLSAMAQKGNVPAEYANFTFLRTEYRGGDNFTDVYQDSNGALYEANMVCPSCPKPAAPGVVTTSPNLSNTNTVTTYDLALERQKFEADIAYKNELLKQRERELKIANKSANGQIVHGVFTGLGTMAMGAGLIMSGDAAEKGKFGTNIIQNIFGSTTTDPITPGGPWMGSTHNTDIITDPVTGGPIIGATTISNTDPRWNPLLNIFNTNGFTRTPGPVSGQTSRVIIN